MTTISEQPLAGSFWADVREALRGTRRNLTDGSPRRAIFLLAVPMVLEMVMESLFALVDVYFVSGLGAPHAATVGLTEAMMAIVLADHALRHRGQCG